MLDGGLQGTPVKRQKLVGLNSLPLGGSHNLPAREDIKAGSQVCRARQIMGGHYDRAATGGDFTQYSIEHRAGILIQTGVRLVEQHYFWIVDDSPPNSQALLHPARKCTYQISSAGSQTNDLQYMTHPAVQVSYSIEFAKEAKILLGGQIAVKQGQV